MILESKQPTNTVIDPCFAEYAMTSSLFNTDEIFYVLGAPGHTKGKVCKIQS